MNVVARSILICTAAWSISVSAQEPEPAETPMSFLIQPIIVAGFTFGTDKQVEIEYNDGSSEGIDAADLLELKLGLKTELPEHPITLQTSIGFNFDSYLSKNGEASVTRLPLELLAFYNLDKHRAGAGFSYHVNPALQLDYDDISLNSDADDTLGMVVEYGYLVKHNFILGVRYLSIDYEFKGPNEQEDVDGSHFGIYGNILF